MPEQIGTHQTEFTQAEHFSTMHDKTTTSPLTHFYYPMKVRAIKRGTLLRNRGNTGHSATILARHTTSYSKGKSKAGKQRVHRQIQYLRTITSAISFLCGCSQTGTTEPNTCSTYRAHRHGSLTIHSAKSSLLLRNTRQSQTSTSFCLGSVICVHSSIFM